MGWTGAAATREAAPLRREAAVYHCQPKKPTTRRTMRPTTSDVSMAVSTDPNQIQSPR